MKREERVVEQCSEYRNEAGGDVKSRAGSQTSSRVERVDLVEQRSESRSEEITDTKSREV